MLQWIPGLTHGSQTSGRSGRLRAAYLHRGPLATGMPRVVAAVCVALLAACGGGGGSDAAGAAAVGGAPRGPTARFSAEPSEGPAPLEVRFDAAASTDGDDRIVAYAWQFGDDSASDQGPALGHVFEAPGTYQITLQVTDAAGRTGTTTRTVRAFGATLGGTIDVEPGTDVDSDPNTRSGVAVRNNTFATAQSLTAPVQLGGFVNMAGTGAPEGRFFAEGDVEDFHAFAVEAEVRAVLAIDDADAIVDLELYRAGSPPVLVDASVADGRLRDLTVPGPGDYVLRVVARAGASSYVLTISDPADALPFAAVASRLTDRFVPGDVLVAESLGRETRRYELARSARGGRYGLVAAAGRAAARSHREVAQPERIAAAGARVNAMQERRYRTLLAARALRREPGVVIAEVNVVHRPLRVPNDPEYRRQWHYGRMELPQAWDVTTGGDTGRAPVVVAVVDTGVLLDHPDLRSRILRDGMGAVIGYDFVQDPARANDGDGIDPDPDDPGDDARGPGSGSFHGTLVAGTIGADTDNALGVAGVSWDARIMPVRALGIDGGTSYDLQQAIRYAAGLPNVSGRLPAVTADIINLSVGSSFSSATEQQTLNEVRARGILVVASAGNDGSATPVYPAGYQGVLAVSATTAGDTLASYSNFGPHIDLAAPGGDAARTCGPSDCVFSTAGSGGGAAIAFGYGPAIGTSMAAPHVSGVIALMKALFPTLRPEGFDTLLASGALTDDLGTAGRDDRFGHGRLNARKAVQAALELAAGTTPTPMARLTASATRLNFGTFLGELDVAIGNAGSAPVAVTLAADAPWLTIGPLAVDADGLGAYRIFVQRSQLPPGIHEAVVRVEPSDPAVDAVSIAVVARVIDAAVVPDAGLHFVVLVDEALEVVRSLAVSAIEGRYAFTLADVPPGRYRLFAGSDLDGDGRLCTAAESCGAYPNLGNPLELVVDAAVTPRLEGLDFTTGYRTGVGTTPSVVLDGEPITLPTRR
ncbi:MAG: S8 family serine peptidase [Pseudomonadales bacterium]|nr:S8 family serine peptidase [Pseudomonadales bacterium]